ncbi:hypothetical protein ACFL96_19925, partial [Thermoproteota archaeon]
MSTWMTTVEYILVKWIWNPPGYAIVEESLGTIIRVMCSFYTCKMTDGAKLLNIVPMFASAGGYVTGQGEGSGGSFEGKISSGTSRYDAYDLDYDGHYKEGEGTGEDVDPDVDLSAEGETYIKYNHSDGTLEMPNNDGAIWGDEDAGTEPLDDSGAPYDHSMVPLVDMFSSFRSDPWRSRYTAFATLCIPMILYSYKKEKQIRCLEYRCTQNRAQADFDISMCEKQRKVRECLYVYGAEYQLLGKTQNKWAYPFRMAITVMFNELTVGLFAMINTIACDAACTQKTSSEEGEDADSGDDLSTEVDLEDEDVFGDSDTLFEDGDLATESGGGASEGTSGAASTFQDQGGETNPWAIVLALIIIIFGGSGASGGMLSMLFMNMIYSKINNQYESVFYETDMDQNSDCLTKWSWGWVGWIACDLLLSITIGIDSGEWIFYEGSWDLQALFRDVESPNYCSGIEAI